MTSTNTGTPIRRCPRCSSTDAVPILYGFPLGEMIDAAESGRAALGGCVVEPTSSAWQCRACHRRFGPLADENLTGAAFAGYVDDLQGPLSSPLFDTSSDDADTEDR